MARSEKVAVVDEVREGLSSSAATLLTDYRGLTVAELAELRAELRKVGARYRVAKNTLMRRAADEAGIEGLAEFLVGPTALAFCDEDPVGPAKALKKFAKDHPELVVKGAYLDGEVLDAAAATKLADLESREEVLAGIAGLINGAFAMVLNYADAVGRDILGLVTALEGAGGPAAKGFGPAAGEAGASAAEAPAVDASAGPVETVVEAVSDVVETVAETVADAAEAVADKLEDAAEAVRPEETADAAAEAPESDPPA